MNRWKAFALIMIGLLIIVAGFRFAYAEMHLFPLDKEQKDFAIKSAGDGLKNEIEGKDYNVTAADRGGRMSTIYGEKKVAFVVFTSGNTTLSALVDLETGEVVEKSRIEYSGWMMEYKRGAHKRLFR